jgi:hypothetical protein
VELQRVEPCRHCCRTETWYTVTAPMEHLCHLQALKHNYTHDDLQQGGPPNSHIHSHVALQFPLGHDTGKRVAVLHHKL